MSGHVVALWCNNQRVPGGTPALRTNGSTGKEPGLFGPRRLKNSRTRSLHSVSNGDSVCQDSEGSSETIFTDNNNNNRIY